MGEVKIAFCIFDALVFSMGKEVFVNVVTGVANTDTYRKRRKTNTQIYYTHKV
jgi:hypothetical protein